MQYTPDFARLILLELNKFTCPPYHDELQVEGYSLLEVKQQVYLMMEAGLVDAYESRVEGDPPGTAIAVGIMEKGWDFLDQ
jgi:hypothetical protein